MSCRNLVKTFRIPGGKKIAVDHLVGTVHDPAHDKLGKRPPGPLICTHARDHPLTPPSVPASVPHHPHHLPQCLTTSLTTSLTTIILQSVDIMEGQITALLGHNGAGKTTTISVLTGNNNQHSQMKCLACSSCHCVSFVSQNSSFHSHHNARWVFPYCRVVLAGYSAVVFVHRCVLAIMCHSHMHPCSRINRPNQREGDHPRERYRKENGSYP